MDTEQLTTRSVWHKTAEVPRFPPLAEDLGADVCVIGAGVAGLSTALFLAREGLSVVVVDGGPIGGGETGRTTAHLATALDDRFREVERLHGARGAQLAYQSQAAAVDAIERVVVEESIECAFRRLDGYLFLGAGESESFLDEEFDAARRAGCASVERLAKLHVAGRDLGPCLRFLRQGEFHPLRYVAGVAHAVVRRGAHIFEQARAIEIEAQGERATRVRFESGRVIEASHVVVATNTPFNDRVVIHTKQAAYRTYAIAARVRDGSIRRALYWDTEDPYHYVRLHAEPRDHDERLIIGGEDHKTGQEDDPAARFARLEAWARELFPGMQNVEERWSGQVLEPVDGVAFIGRNPGGERNVYVATGDSGMGMTHGTIAGMLITDLIAGRDNEWAALYDPSRKTLRAAGKWLSENLNVAAQAATLFTAGEVGSVEDIPPGSGAVIRRGLAKIAVFRDQGGVAHERSAICPHLGCVVAWNDVEKSWDCPCHGSRFDVRGKVLTGPADRDLGSAE
jgi:glycine/D-amino acid oxidase-like deaminating enzyme/nitrite reductase/ring-hydroxylating ferredoxin subunit